MSFSFQNHHALFGGSFNPPHLGHLEAIQGLFQDPKVAQVTVLPSFGTPLKTTAVPFQDRYEMAKLAFPNTVVSQFEQQEKIQYTSELLEKMASKHAKLAFVIGTDQFSNLDRWNRFPEVLALSDWIVLIRKPNKLDDSQSAIQKLVRLGVISGGNDPFTFSILGSSKTLKFVETNARAISSTAIRENFSLGKISDVKPLIPEAVFQYIERNKLYGT